MAEDQAESGVQGALLLQEKKELPRIDVLSYRTQIVKCLIELMKIPRDPNKPSIVAKMLENHLKAKVTSQIWGELPVVEGGQFYAGAEAERVIGLELHGTDIGMNSNELAFENVVTFSRNAFSKSDHATVRWGLVMGDGSFKNAREVLVDGSVVWGDGIFDGASGLIKNSIIASRNTRFQNVRHSAPITLKNIWLVNSNGEATHVIHDQIPYPRKR